MKYVECNCECKMMFNENEKHTFVRFKKIRCKRNGKFSTFVFVFFLRSDRNMEWKSRELMNEMWAVNAKTKANQSFINRIFILNLYR